LAADLYVPSRPTARVTEQVYHRGFTQDFQGRAHAVVALSDMIGSSQVQNAANPPARLLISVAPRQHVALDVIDRRRVAQPDLGSADAG
jgi:hypothetical protein